MLYRTSTVFLILLSVIGLFLFLGQNLGFTFVIFIFTVLGISCFLSNYFFKKDNVTCSNFIMVIPSEVPCVDKGSRFECEYCIRRRYEEDAE